MADHQAGVEKVCHERRVLARIEEFVSFPGLVSIALVVRRFTFCMSRIRLNPQHSARRLRAEGGWTCISAADDLQLSRFEVKMNEILVPRSLQKVKITELDRENFRIKAEA